MATLQQHYKRLRQTDLKSWNTMNGKLASRLHYQTDLLTYFRRSILTREEKGIDPIDLATLPSWITKQFVDHMGFTWDDIWENTIPALPALVENEPECRTTSLQAA